ncbi:VOC family protein [Marinoscillum furvescens]|nr:VOC family protein [Marinoscillum furvescens]
MNYTRVLLIGMLAAICSCESRNEFEIRELNLITTQPEKMAKWYEQHLNFQASNDYDLLYHDNLTITLEERKKAKHPDTLKRAYNITRLPGLYKFGFITNQFDELVTTLETSEVEMVGNVVHDNSLKRRTLIIKDPDGNRIQLFEDHGPHKLKPYFLALTVEDIGLQEKWYQMKLPLTEVYNLDLKEQSIFIRLLEGENLAVELVQLNQHKVQESLDRSQLVGYHSLKMKGLREPFQQDAEGNLLIVEN